jgi:hypothetical protein
MGYRVLPITRVLFKEQFLYGPGSKEYIKSLSKFKTYKR